MSVQYLD